MNDLHFAVTGAKTKAFAASPTIVFRLHIGSSQRVEALVLRVEVRIEPQWRGYKGTEQAVLDDLFGSPERWNTTLRSLTWADVSVTVPGFSGQTEIDVPVACTFDFDVAATRFFHALRGGEIPLRLLFSGAIFSEGPNGFSTERVSWSSECSYRMPFQVWNDAMRACYGDDAVIRIKRETLERLHRYRALSGATSWDELFARLLEIPT